jgi:hypothetical protein
MWYVEICVDERWVKFSNPLDSEEEADILKEKYEKEDNSEYRVVCKWS